MTDLLHFCIHTENRRLVRLVTSPQEYATAQNWYQNHVVFRLILDGLLSHLNVPAGDDLGMRLHTWGSRDFDFDYQNRDYVTILNSLRNILEKEGGLTASGLVTPDTTPKNSPGRGGAGGGSTGGGSGCCLALALSETTWGRADGRFRGSIGTSIFYKQPARQLRLMRNRILFEFCFVVILSKKIAAMVVRHEQISHLDPFGLTVTQLKEPLPLLYSTVRAEQHHQEYNIRKRSLHRDRRRAVASETSCCTRLRLLLPQLC